MPTLKRLRRGQRNRRAMPQSVRNRGGLIIPTGIALSTNDVIVTYPVVVSLKGIPKYLTSTSKLPTAAVRTAPTEVTLTYDTPGSPTGITVPERDPAVRGSDGGYVAPGVYLFPE